MAYTDGGEWVGVSRIGPDASADPLERLVAAVESIDRRLGALEDRHRADVEADAGLRDRIERVADQVSDLAKGVDALGERVDRSSDAVQAGTDALSELSANASSTRDALRTLRQATATESSANRDGFVEVRDQVAEIDRRIVSRAQMDDVRQRIEQAERSLAHQANVIGEAIRSRVDDQRVLSRELAAQISALNAAVSTSEPSSELVRRDVQSTVEVLAERVAHAMGELRSDFREAQSRQARALASSDTTRVDASQLSSTLRSVQDSTDERLRRIDGQLSELRNSLDLLRWGGGRRDHRDGDDAGRASRSDVDAASVIDPADHGTGDSWTGDPGDVGHHDVDAGDGDDRDLDRRDLEGRDLEGRDLDAPVDDHDHDHDHADDDAVRTEAVGRDRPSAKRTIRRTVTRETPDDYEPDWGTSDWDVDDDRFELQEFADERRGFPGRSDGGATLGRDRAEADDRTMRGASGDQIEDAAAEYYIDERRWDQPDGGADENGPSWD